MKIFKLQAPLSLLILACPWILQAEDIPMTGPMPFKSMDSNGDNVISPDEYVRAYNQRKKMQQKAGLRHTMREPGFLYFDVNGDNRISAQELTDGRIKLRQQKSGTGRVGGQGMGPGMGMGRGRGQGQGQGMAPGRNMPKFSDFDLNNDGVLHKDEFYEARAKRMYMRADQGFPMKNAASAPQF